MWLLLLLLIIILISYKYIKGGEFNDFKKHYNTLWHITESLRGTSEWKKYKNIYIEAYYSNKYIYDEIIKHKFNYTITKRYKQNFTLQNKQNNVKINLKYLSWPSKNWSITPDFLKKLYNFYVFDTPIDINILNLNHLNVVDIFSDPFSKRFWHYCTAYSIPNETLCGVMGNWVNFLKTNTTYDIFAFLPKIIKICEYFAKLIKLQTVKIFICVHKDYLDIFPDYKKKIKIEDLYSSKYNLFKKTDKYWGLYL